MRLLSGLVAAASAFLLVTAAAAAKPCHQDALAKLKQLSPEGFAIYQQMKDKSGFTHWISCDDIQLNLATAVHEGAHMLAHEIDAYPLIKGGKVPRVAAHRSLFPPRLIAHLFKRDSSFVETYLTVGHATSAEEFGYLLDELNAYAHDLNTAVKLAAIADPKRDVFHRDGLAALMAFTAAYIERARVENGATWSMLQKAEIRGTTTALWQQAELVMGASCRLPRYSLESPEYLRPVCAANIRHGLGALLGRPPLCPVSCARAMADAKRR